MAENTDHFDKFVEVCERVDNPYLGAAEVAWGCSVLSGVCGGPFGKVLSVGFGFFSTWAADQDLTLAAAYGADYVMTDFLIQMYREGKCKECKYDKKFRLSNQIGIEYTQEVAQKEGRPGKWGAIENTINPWLSEEDFMLPLEGSTAAIHSYNSDLLKEKFPSVRSWNGDYYVEPVFFSTDRFEPDPNTMTDTVPEYGYKIEERELSLDELSMIQAIIYHYCSWNDWRMMMAEGHRRGTELGEKDFQYSLQYMNGFRLSGDITDGIGLLIMGKGGPYDGHNLNYVYGDLEKIDAGLWALANAGEAGQALHDFILSKVKEGWSAEDIMATQQFQELDNLIAGELGAALQDGCVDELVKWAAKHSDTAGKVMGEVGSAVTVVGSSALKIYEFSLQEQNRKLVSGKADRNQGRQGMGNSNASARQTTRGDTGQVNQDKTGVNRNYSGTPTERARQRAG